MDEVILLKIAAYIKNENLPDIELRTVVKGNPGVGGTEYMFMIVLYELSLDPLYDITIYSNKPFIKTESINNILVKDFEAAIDDAVIKKYDYFILRNCMPTPISKYTYPVDTKFIMWSHNYIEYDEAMIISSNPNIVANVFVSRQMYDRYIDHDIIKKSTYIYNFINTEFEPEFSIKENIVMYNGSVVPAKGLHVLAKVWPEIIKEIPDAKLYVMGTGNLYNRKEKLGELGVTSASYEKLLIKLLGNSINSVKFLGMVDKDKNRILSKAKIGVVNPTAGTETFCISAVDFENCGVPVVTRGKNGLLDVVTNKSGILINSHRELQKAICKLLKNDKLCEELGREAKKYSSANFGIDKNISKWKQLFCLLETGEELPYIKPENYFSNNLKWMKIINRRVRKIFGLSNKFTLLNYKWIVLRLLRK